MVRAVGCEELGAPPPGSLTLSARFLGAAADVPFRPQICQKQARMRPGQALPLCLRSAESVTQSQPTLEGAGPEGRAASPGKRAIGEAERG